MVAGVCALMALFAAEAWSASNFAWTSGEYFDFTMRLEKVRTYKVVVGVYIVTPVVVWVLGMVITKTMTPFEYVLCTASPLALLCYSIYKLLSPCDDTEYLKWDQTLLRQLCFQRPWYGIVTGGNDSLYHQIVSAGLDAGRGQHSSLEKLCADTSSAHRLFGAMGLAHPGAGVGDPPSETKASQPLLE